MHARHVTVRGSSEKIEQGVRSVREQVLPVLKGCSGFRGQLLLVDREKGEAIGISLWDSEADMDASEDKVRAARQLTADEVAATAPPEVRVFELAVYEKA